MSKACDRDRSRAYNATAVKEIGSIASQAIAERVTPGGVVAFGDDDHDEVLSFGATTYGGDVVTPATIYDIASLSKPVSTVSIAMKLVEDGRLELDQPLRSIFSDVPEDITFANLLGHTAGYPAHIEFFRLIKPNEGRQRLLALAREVEQERGAGQKSVYSDVGFILLGFAMEAITGRRLDQLFRELVAEPLGMTQTTYVDNSAGARHPSLERVAPTEECPWRETLVHGVVHDENTFAAGGICGHAGLFAPIGDLVLFVQNILRAWREEQAAVFDADVVQQFFSRRAAEGSSWRMGWDTPSTAKGVSHAGDAWPRQDSVGHLAFTGCSMWIGKARSRYALILTNRVHPTRQNQGIRELRRNLMDAISRALGI